MVMLPCPVSPSILDKAEAFASAFGPTVAAFLFGISTAAITVYFSRLQAGLAEAKLVQDHFDRRFQVYRAFQRLVLAVVEGSDWKSWSEEANDAYAVSGFLFGPEVQEYLDHLYKDAFRVASTPELFNKSGMFASEQERIAFIAKHLDEKMQLSLRLAPLAELLKPYLQLIEPGSKRPRS